MEFLGLMDLTQRAGLDPQGVAYLTDRENWGRCSNDMNGRRMGGGEDGSPHQRGGIHARDGQGWGVTCI